MNSIPAVVLAIAAVVGSATAAWAQDPDQDKKIRDEAMKERVDALEKKQQEGVSFTNSNGLKFKSGDGNFEGAIGGRFYFVYRHVFERADGGGSLADSFVVDTARIQLDGTFYKDYFYRIEAEFAKNGSFALKDGWIGWKGVDDLAIQFGQMKEPFSQEETCSSRFIDFAERSILNRIVPAHDIGMMGKGALLDKVLEWELGIFNGNSRNASGRNVNDINDEKDITARLRVNPFRTSSNDWIKQLRIGVAYGIGDVDSTAIGDITTGDLSGLTVLDFTGTEDGLRTRLGLELSWIMGSASVRAEYVIHNQEVISGTGTDDFDIKGYYVQASYILTGENKPLENRVIPKKNFNLREGTWGAWELAIRFAGLDASDGESAGVIAATANQEVTEFTFGVNWWMTPNVRLMLNFERFSFDEDIPQAGNDPISDQSIFYTRFQIDF